MTYVILVINKNINTINALKLVLYDTGNSEYFLPRYSLYMNYWRFFDKTPHSVTAFLAGRLPGTALVHLRLLSNFGMIARNPSSILHKLGLEFFSHKLASKSWFSQIRDICLLYQLPHPLSFMLNHQTRD